ncbi:CCKAR [Biomphalaria glabrata]|nr:hypothetical protein BgiMline_025570 [Biomphalaria glabrata]KAI8795257.1 CCKAR [Biomphalaria glabrata]
MYLFVQTFNIPLSSLIMVAIGFDRYFCICHPFLHAVTVPRAKWCVGILTVIAALIGIVPMLSHGVYHPVVRQVNVTLSSPPAQVRASTTPFSDGLFVQPLPVYNVDPGESINYKTGSLDALAPTPVTPMDEVKLDVDVGQWVVPMNVTEVDYFGICIYTYFLLSEQFVDMYLKVYASLFLVEFIVLALLYALIYRSILARRAWKNKRKRTSCYTSTNCPETVAEETQLTHLNGTATETVLLKAHTEKMSTAMMDRALYANIKTAAMLFVVTVVFVISFLPSWLMGLKLLPFSYIAFYMFYINNVVNPIIYAFMNRTFRDDLVQLLRSCVRRY